MDYADYSKEMKKICADIQREMDQLRIERFLKSEMRDWQDRIAFEIFNHKPQSERDAAACRATEIRTVSNGRPQFYIPDLGE